MSDIIKTLSDDDLWRAYETQKETRGEYDSLTQEIAAELEDRGYELHPITTDDYKEWAAASCGMDYYASFAF